MLQTELLAPAKDKETAICAIDCGADAVYIGASNFGARHNASNSLEDITEVVNYAHKFWAKVYVTVNTILSENELDSAINLVQELENIGVDAVIIQDMGLIERIIELQKEGKCHIPIHISTQCDNRTSDKVKFFNKLGVSRVVLARELSLDNIKKIHEDSPNVELEAFVHGALCVSYSGQCYLSQYIGGRSANRGECAQPCRKKYTVETTDGKVLAKDIYALCLKDFNASNSLKEMIDSGVYSFKIEGRLKEVGYVKNVTAYYRHELDKYSKKASSGKSFYEFIPNPEKSFNRGFTDYFLEKRKDCFNFKSPKSRGEYLGKIVDINSKAFKIKTHKEIHPQDGLTNGEDGVLVNKIEKGYIYPNRIGNFKNGDVIYRNVDSEFEKELSKPVKRQIAIKVFVDEKIKITDEDGISIVSEFPSKEVAQNVEKMRETFVKQFSKTGTSDFYVEDVKVSSELPFLPVSAINELRRFMLDELMKKRLQEYKKEVQNNINYTNFYKDKLDYRANIHNQKAKNFYEKCGCDVCEMSLESHLPDHKIELMRTKHCIKYALGICREPVNLVLKDEFGKVYPLFFDCKNCEMVIFNK